MDNPIQTNLRIKAKDMYADERELLSMLRAAYKDYWQTKNDGGPRTSESQGNYWVVNHRVSGMDDGEPLIEKEIYYRKPNGEKIQIADHIASPETTLSRGLEREREIIEIMAFLSTGYEAHERGPADIARIDEAAQHLDIFHMVGAGIRTRKLLSDDYNDINNDPEDHEVVNWLVIAPDLENWSSLNRDLKIARNTGVKLPLPPSDEGHPRFEQIETDQIEGQNSPDDRIRF